MSQQCAAKFLELLAINPNLRTHQALANAWNVSDLTRFAAGKGFMFSEGDLKQALQTFDFAIVRRGN